MTSKLFIIHQRHAIYYWTILRELHDQYAKDTLKTLRQLSNNWGQITQGQQWAGANLKSDQVACTLVSAYPRFGAFLLRFKLPPLGEKQWYLQALDSAQIQEDEYLQSVHLNDLGGIALILADYHEAARYFGRALRIAQQINDPIELGRSIAGTGELYAYQGDFDKAESLYATALSFARKGNAQNLISSILNLLGMLFVETEHYEEAIMFLEESVNYSKQLGDQYQQITKFISLGIAHVHAGHYEKGTKILEDILKNVEITNDLTEKSRLLGGLGVAYRHLNCTDEGIVLLRQSIHHAQLEGDRLSMAIRQVNLALLYAQKDDVEHTLHYLESGRELFQELGLDNKVQMVDDYLQRVHDSIQL